MTSRAGIVKIPAIVLVVAGVFSLCITVILLGNYTCTPECTEFSAFGVSVSLLAGIVLLAIGVPLGIYRYVKTVRMVKSGKLPPSTLKRPGAVKSKKGRITLVIVGVIIIGLLLLVLIRTGNQPEWVFDGAYADYSSANGVVPFYSVTLRVVTYNQSYAEVMFQTYGAMHAGSTFTSNSTDWVLLQNSRSNPFVNKSATYLGSPSSTSFTLEKKALSVTSYSFSYQDYTIQNNNFTFSQFRVLEDQCVAFPIALIFTFQNGGNVTLHLLKTNIPGLLPSLPLNNGPFSGSCPS